MNATPVDFGLGLAVNKPGFAHLKIRFDLFSAFCSKCGHIKIHSKGGSILDPIPELLEFLAQKYGFVQRYLFLIITIFDIEVA